jgi:PAS domain S-box-containing protein
MKRKQINIFLSVAVVIFLIFIAVLVFYLNKGSEGEIIALAEKQQILTAKQITTSIESYLQLRAQGLKVLSSFKSIKRKNLEQIADDVNSYYKYVKSYFVNSISVFDENGIVIYSTSKELIGKNYSNFDFWKKLTSQRSENLLYTPIVVLDTSGNTLFRKPLSFLVSPVYEKDKFLGAVGYTIEIDSLINSFIKTFEPEIKLYDTWILTSDKILIFHSAHPEMLLRKAQIMDKNCLNCHINFNYIDTMLSNETGVVRYRLKNYPEKLAGFSRFKIFDGEFIFAVTTPFENLRKIATANLRFTYLIISITVFVLLIYGYIFFRNLRETIRAEEERKQREARERIQKLYTLLLQNSNDGIYILDLAERKFIEVNKKFQEMFGYTLEELNNTDFMMLVAPESRPMIEERMQKIARGVPVPQRYTFTALAKDGRRIEVETSVSYVRFGEKLYVLGIYRDISEILRQRELYMNLFENLPVGVVIHQDGKIVKCNRKAIEIGGGKTEEDIIGKPVLDFVHPDYREIVKERIKNIIEQGEYASPIEEKFVKLDGSIIDVEVRASKVIWEGRPAVQVVVEDVSERKRLYRELSQMYKNEEELRLKFETIFKNLGEGIYFQNENGIIELVNDEFCKILGYKSPDELIGKPFSQFLEELKELVEDPEEIERIREAVEKRKILKYPELKLKNGKVIERVGVPIYDANGKYIGRVGFARDITEKKQREREVLELQRFELLGQIASGIAHDFNNVLGIIMGMLEIVKFKTQDQNILNYIESALSATQRGSEIAKRLLQFSKKKIEEFKPISVKELVLDSAKIIEHTIPKNISLDVKAELDFVIFGSYGDLQQVILNLALNARDAMPDGGKLLIEVLSVDKNFVERKFGKATSDVYAVISVSDTGVGIKDELKEKIFEPFFTTKEPGKGTGLGLPIVKNIVTLHNGFVDFETAIGKGTTFYVYLPVHIADEKEVKINRGGKEMKKIGDGFKALVVEDEESLRIVMRDYLEMLGFKVIEAEDGEEGLKKFKENPDIKIAFIDYGLPKMLGDELINRIHEISKDVKFVLITGFVDLKIRHSLPEGTRFMKKPYNLSSVEEIVNELIGGK